MNTLNKYVNYRRAAAFPIFGLIAALFLAAVGTFFVINKQQTKDFPTTDATIVDFASQQDADGEMSYSTIVSYTVDGVEYSATIGYSSTWRVGDTVQVKYNPENPAEVNQETGIIGYIFLGVAAVVLVLSVRGFFVNAKRIKATDEQDKAIAQGTFVPQNDAYGAYYEPNTEVKYYFTLDKHLMQGAYMEDANRVKVYEAVFEKFSLFTAAPCTFINHINFRKTTHKIGHSVTSGGESDFSSRSTFKYDGQDVWDYLHNNGIRIRTDIQSGAFGMQYTVTRMGKPYAVVTTCGPKIHEEDAGNGVMSKLTTARGFYRITAYSDDIDLLFLTVFTFSRVDQIYCD